MTATRGEDREFWREFIAVYRDLPELWKVKSEDYKNRNKKNAAYETLVVKMKDIDPMADRASVRAKINSIRTAYRRELRKITESKKSGGETDVYLPSLWYFDDIDFLRKQETQTQGSSTMEKTGLVEEIDELDDMNEMEIVLSEANWSREQVIKLIELYHEHSVLWDPTRRGFKDRRLKNNAWTEIGLAMKLTKPEVQTKMRKLIGQFQRECKKERSGSGAVGNKWYAFDALLFIKDKCAQRQMAEVEVDPQHTVHEVTVCEDSSHSSELQPTPTRKRTLPQKNESPDREEAKLTKMLPINKDRLENPSSEAQIIANAWAVEYSKMSPDQQLYAKKFIDDILFEGRLGNLHRDSISINSTQTLATSNHPLFIHHSPDYVPYPHLSISAPPSPPTHAKPSTQPSSSK